LLLPPQPPGWNQEETDKNRAAGEAQTGKFIFKVSLSFFFFDLALFVSLSSWLRLHRVQTQWLIVVFHRI
jgi:hypothetical protein